jgi:hypothetical protein
MPESGRFVSNRSTAGLLEGFSTTVIGCPIGGGMVPMGVTASPHADRTGRG